MPIRKKRNVLAVTSMPQKTSEGRRAVLVRAKGPRLSRTATACTMRLWSAVCALVAAQRAEHHKPTARTTEDRQQCQRAVRDMMYELRKATGRAAAVRTRDLMLHDGGLLASAVSKASADVRPYLDAAVMEAIAIADERGIDDTLALSIVFKRAMWSALESADLGAATHSTGDAQSAAFKRALQAGQRASALVLTLAHVSRDANPVAPALDVAGILARRTQDAPSASPCDDEREGVAEPDESEEAATVEPEGREVATESRLSVAPPAAVEVDITEPDPDDPDWDPIAGAWTRLDVATGMRVRDGTRRSPDAIRRGQALEARIQRERAEAEIARREGGR